MAIAFDSAVDGGNGANTLTFSFTNTAGNIVFVGAIATGDLVTAVSYGGSSTTLVGKITTGGLTRYLFVQTSPATGANNVVITSTAGYLAGGAVSYSGASTSGQPDNSATNSVTNGGPTVTTTLTTVADNCWTVIYFGSSASTLTAGTGTTKRTADDFGHDGLFDSNAAITPAGSSSLVVTMSGFDTANAIMASFAPPAAAGDTLLGQAVC